MSDESAPQQPEGTPRVGYKSRPPLWTPGRKQPLSARELVLGTIVGGALVAILMLLVVGGSVLSVPAGQVEVTVVRLEGGRPPDEGPGVFRHLVTLPDGSETRFRSERPHRPGERLLITRFRSRLTGHVSLAAPYRSMGPAPATR